MRHGAFNRPAKRWLGWGEICTNIRVCGQASNLVCDLNRESNVIRPVALFLMLSTSVWTGAFAGEPAPDLAIQTDGRHDFDFFIGSWKIKNRMIKPGTKNEWIEFDTETTDRSFLAGLGNMDEMTLPHDRRGVSLRFFDPAKKEWSIYWANSASGLLELPPVVGKFESGVGYFYSDDIDADKVPIKVRYHWTHAGQNTLHWDMAWSYNGGKTWDDVWTMEFTRM